MADFLDHFSCSQETGCVFTPIKWAKFAVKKYGLFGDWLNGATILDPTMGEGNLLHALIETGIESGYTMNDLPVQNLFGIELNTKIFNKAVDQLEKLCGRNFVKENFVNADTLFFTFNRKFDLIFGNPPWVGFSSLPDRYKEQLKSLFVSSGLAKSGNRMLLGNSQINIAALIVFRMMTEFLKDQGKAVVFMPLNVLFHSGAHSAFTEFRAENVDFCINEVRDLAQTGAFPDVSTKFGILQMTKGETQKYPVDYYRFQHHHNKWEKNDLVKLFGTSGPLRVISDVSEHNGFEKISIPRESRPRQGINTCGANRIFFFDYCEPVGKKMCSVSNSNGQFLLPQQFIYPLIDKTNFHEDRFSAKKHVLLPYHPTGKLIQKFELEGIPQLRDYLYSYVNVLSGRKGQFIRSSIEKGNFWALLGIGPYNFFPYKIVWQACGKNKFEPLIFSGNLQANQALQTYLPFRNKSTCYETYEKLMSSRTNEVLESMQMGGTMCFAQAGVMSHFFTLI
jgi:methylase of polypeptide subunit release factors